jgi:hypothetical protein
VLLLSFRHHGAEYSNTTMGESLFDVAASALEFFCSPNWNGPRPRRDTLLEVTILGDQRRYRVVAGRIESWVWEQAGAENLLCSQ